MSQHLRQDLFHLSRAGSCTDAKVEPQAIERVLGGHTLRVVVEWYVRDAMSNEIAHFATISRRVSHRYAEF